MGRWDSPSPTRARSRSPRDGNRKDDRRDKDRGGDRDGHRKRSRWEDDDKGDERVGSRGDGKEVVRRRDDRDRDRERDRDRDMRRDDGGGSSRRDRDRGGRERERERDRSRDRERTQDRNRDDRRRRDNKDHKPRTRSKDRNPSKEEKEEREEEEPEAPPKEAPNFSRTTHLITETNSLNGVVLKYVEPSESRLPPSSITYRLYIFKSSDLLETITLSTRTAWLFGRDRLVADIPIDHPSASKQHAVIQFRFVVKVNEYGEREGGVKPYIIDLGSANGTKVNGGEVPKERYFELKEKDVIGFGHSSREYVLMVEK
ncbi:hypothetical protein TWF281_009205 [Arthrobotrys megalospora]